MGDRTAQARQHRKQAVLTHLDRGPCTFSDLLRRTSIGPQHLHPLLEGLVREGKVSKVGGDEPVYQKSRQPSHETSF